MDATARYRFHHLVLLSVLLVSVNGCAATQDQPPAEEVNKDLVTCTDPRPQMCTMEYKPVCARLGEGAEAEWKTYASGCSACGDPKVTVYKSGGECQ